MFSVTFLKWQLKLSRLMDEREVTTTGLPHENVFARIAPSKLAPTEEFGHGNVGVGVFAIRDIRAGTCIFHKDRGQLTEVRRESLESLAPALKKLYQDFCILTDDSYACPVSFNQLTPCWYFNSSESPNVIVDKNLRYVALRNIKTGEELTVRYRDYSQNQSRPLL